jgi:hypothetical protein
LAPGEDRESAGSESRGGGGVNVFLWHVHGSWTTSLVQGPHTYLVPVLPGRGRDGLGRAQTWSWPDSVIEVTPEEAGDADIDVVLLQRPHELGLAQSWLHRRPGTDIPAVYVEHNAPQGSIAEMRHPMAERSDLVLVHVTHFNALFWDPGSMRSVVIEHGIVDPGYRYIGELDRAVVTINEARRRGRVTGTDLLARFRRVARLDIFGMDGAAVGGRPGLTQDEVHEEMARRRVYLHPIRWTSLGLSLIEAMQLGMPVVALSTTEVPEAVPPEAGVVSNRMDELAAGLRRFIDDPEVARVTGRAARATALERYSLKKFLRRWDELLAEVAG